MFVIQIDASLDTLLQDTPLHQVMMKVLSSSDNRETLPHDLLLPCFQSSDDQGVSYPGFQGQHQAQGVFSHESSIPNALPPCPEESTLVIRPPFLLGLIHEQVASVIEMPLVTFRVLEQHTIF